MKNIIKPWDDGGSLSVTYDGSGDGSAVFSSDVAEGLDREMTVTFSDDNKAITIERKVKQTGKREVFTGYDDMFITADGETFNSIKDGLQ